MNVNHTEYNYQCIMAVDSQFGIAKNGNIPWRSNTDLNFFKEKTMNGVVIMGAKTFITISKPLPNRLNIVVTSNAKEYQQKYSQYSNTCLQFVSLNECKDLLKYNSFNTHNVFIIGGNQLFNALSEYCSIFWLTVLNNNYDCDIKLKINLDLYDRLIEYTDEELTIYKLIKKQL